MTAHIFPGQGSQFPGMGKDLYETNSIAKDYFERANDVLGFRISDIMFNGTEEELQQTKITQPAVFILSVLQSIVGSDSVPDAVAGHSLGEFSALTAAKCLSFEKGLELVSKRALAMQKACVANPSTMAAVLNLDDNIIIDVCAEVSKNAENYVVAANFNCNGQVVISGSLTGVEIAGTILKDKGAKRVLPLKVGGGFHSPAMQLAKDELALAIQNADFSKPICPIFQNVDAAAHIEPEEIKSNLIAQLTSPVKWTQIVVNMRKAGIDTFEEYGPGKVLTNLLAKIA